MLVFIGVSQFASFDFGNFHFPGIDLASFFMAESFHWENTSYVSDRGLISQVYEEVKKKLEQHEVKQTNR